MLPGGSTARSCNSKGEWSGSDVQCLDACGDLDPTIASDIPDGANISRFHVSTRSPVVVFHNNSLMHVRSKNSPAHVPELVGPMTRY